MLRAAVAVLHVGAFTSAFVVTGMYAIASLIFVVLIVLDKVVVVPQVEGFWIIFAPFIPCLLVSLPLRSRWLKRRTEEVAQKKDK